MCILKAVLTVSYSLQVRGWMRSMVDSDENRSAEHQLADCRKSDPSARRICQKQFQSRDGAIKVGIKEWTETNHGQLLPFLLNPVIITPHSDLLTVHGSWRSMV